MEYRIAKGWRIAATVFALAFVAGGIALIASPFYSDNMHKTPLLGIFLGIVAGVIGWALWTDTTKSKIVIDDYSINQIGAFKRKSLLLDEIAGYRKEKDFYFLMPKGEGKPIQISNYIENKDEFIAWMKEKYNDFDEAIVGEETKGILADKNFGASEDDRKHALAQATKTAKLFNGVAIAATLWLFIYPKPYQFAWMAVLLVIPLSLIIIWYFKGLVTVNDTKKSAYPSMLPVLLFSNLIVMARALIDYELYLYATAIKYAVGIGAILTGITYYAAYTGYQKNINKKPIIWALAALFVAYGYGAAVFANCYFDTAKADVFTESVTEMHISSGKTTTYYITTTPWGRFTEPEQVSVPKSVYNSLQTGDSVNIYLQPGKLGIPWYFLSKK